MDLEISVQDGKEGKTELMVFQEWCRSSTHLKGPGGTEKKLQVLIQPTTLPTVPLV